MRTILLFVLCLLLSSAVADNKIIEKETAEVDLEMAFTAMAAGEAEQARLILADILKRHPNFRLARMVYADSLAAQGLLAPLLPDPAAQNRERIADLADEATARLRHRTKRLGELPIDIVKLSHHHKHVLLFDAHYSRLYVFENRETMPYLIADYYASSGKGGMGKEREGDNRTPSGVYKITQLLDDAQLSELYGSAAYVLNYPNQWDQIQHRSGSGIWIHGVPRITYSRPPVTSRGCIVSSNAILQWLVQHIDANTTTVVLAKRIDWLSEAQWREHQSRLLSVIEQWRDDWQSLDVERYLAHYSTSYRDKRLDYQQFLSQTWRNAEHKTFIALSIDNIDLFRYSAQPQRYIAYFDQDYKSNNYNISYRKQQIWQFEVGQWKIIFEGRA